MHIGILNLNQSLDHRRTGALVRIKVTGESAAHHRTPSVKWKGEFFKEYKDDETKNIAMEEERNTISPCIFNFISAMVLA